MIISNAACDSFHMATIFLPAEMLSETEMQGNGTSSYLLYLTGWSSALSSWLKAALLQIRLEQCWERHSPATFRYL